MHCTTLRTLVLGAFLLGCHVGQEPAEVPLAIVGATVLPMDAERRMEGATVLVRDGRITAVGADAAVPDDARVIDGAGLFVVPGLADMHVHNWREEDHLLFLANGVTTIRNLWGTEQHLLWRREIAEGRRLGPTIYTSGPILDGDPPVLPGTEALAEPEEVAAAVLAQKEAGYDLIKVYSVLRPEVFEEVLRQARERSLPVTGHVPLAVPLERAFDGGLGGVEHLSGYRLAMQADDSPLRGLTYEEWRALPRPELARLVREHLDPGKLDGLVRQTCAHGVWNTPTLISGERAAASREDLVELSKRDEMRYVPSALRASWDPDVLAERQHLTEEERLALEDGRLWNRKIVRALDAAGCGLLAGTDTPAPYEVPGFSLHEELELLVEAGLTPYAALRSATASAARALGAEGEWGRVAPGLRADLVLLEADPFSSISNTRRLRGVLVRGRWLDAEELGRRLDELARRVAEVPE